jgi:hypothetical protein
MGSMPMRDMRASHVCLTSMHAMEVGGMKAGGATDPTPADGIRSTEDRNNDWSGIRKSDEEIGAASDRHADLNRFAEMADRSRV